MQYHQPSHSAEVAAALEHSSSLSAWLQDQQAEVTPETRRANLAVTFFGICLEHREAIMLLLEHGARTSAFALIRVAFESCMKGYWAADVATDEELKTFFDQHYMPKIETIIKRLGEHHGSNVFAQIKSGNWEAFSDYAHSGARQVGRWLTGDGISPAHSDEEVVEIVRFLDYWGLVASIGINAVAGKPLEPLFARADELGRTHFDK